KIAHMNSSAMKQLKIDHFDSDNKIEIISKNEYIMGEEEFVVKIGKSEYNLIGHLIDIPQMLSIYNKVFVFKQIKKLKNDSYNLTNSHQLITTKDILGKTQSMINLKNTIKRIGASNSTVLITGESGTGKELIARAIHSESKRCNKPFIAINCSAIPDALLESELFGYVKGAFSGANANGRIGKFELANEGVIFLDEIGDMPLHSQVKILRVLEDRKIVRIGSNRLMDLDIRIIAASNKDLKKLIKENKFREDLYYRLNVIPLTVPPLRSRIEDIEFIIDKMIKKYNILFNKNVEKLDKEAKNILLNYSWPGNVRELENTLEYMINIEDGSGILTKDIIPQNILDYYFNKKDKSDNSEDIIPLSEIEKQCILKAIKKYGNDTKGKKMAASALGIGVATLYRKLGEKEKW
ncbi:MAG: sigma-54 interaction domain-containing protein, partial [Clostridiaceae bacterium]